MAAPRAAKQDALAFRQCGPAPLTLILGKEEYSAAWVWNRLKELARDYDPEIQFHTLDASSYQSGTLAHLTAPTIFGGPNAVFVDNVERMNEPFETEASALFDGADTGAIFVLHHRGGNQKRKFVQLLQKHAQVIAVPEIKRDQDKAELVRQLCQDHKQRISPEAVEMLVAALGSDVTELAAAVEQLVNIIPHPIGAADVDRYFGGRVEVASYKVADAAFNGQILSALELSRHSLETGTTPVQLAAVFASRARQVALLSDGNYSPGQAAKKLGLQAWQSERIAHTARRWDGPRISRGIELIAHADHQIKGLSRNAEFACEQMVLKIAQLATGREV